jgi:SapC protein
MSNKTSSNNSAVSVLPLFYKKAVPLNKEIHNDFYIDSIDSYYHTSDTNSIYIAVTEFSSAASEYPIVFAQGENKYFFPVVLLGLKEKQNLYVGKKGEWLADYIPAYVRRYPFILAASNDVESNFSVCIDESYPGFNTAKEGKRLFNKNGQQSAYLKHAVNFLKEYQNQVNATSNFCEKLKEFDLLEPMQANVELKTGDKHSITGISCISRNRLKMINVNDLKTMVDNNYMELIYIHLMSLMNVKGLLNKFK